MEERPKIQQHGPFWHLGTNDRGFIVLGDLPGPVAALNKSGGTVLNREIIERPHGANLEFYFRYSHRVKAVIFVQFLHWLTRIDLNRGCTAKSDTFTMRAKHCIGYLQHLGMGNQVGRMFRQAKQGTQAQSLVAVEIILKPGALPIKMRPEFIHDHFQQRCLGQMFDYHGTISHEAFYDSFCIYMT